MWAFATEQHILSVNQNVSFLSSLARSLSRYRSLSRTSIQIKGNTQNFHKCDDYSFFFFSFFFSRKLKKVCTYNTGVALMFFLFVCVPLFPSCCFRLERGRLESKNKTKQESKRKGRPSGYQPNLSRTSIMSFFLPL